MAPLQVCEDKLGERGVVGPEAVCNFLPSSRVVRERGVVQSQPPNQEREMHVRQRRDKCVRGKSEREREENVSKRESENVRECSVPG